ncbi:MAG: adenylate kinase [Anaerolineae bacterium]|nr:adenylate kinase [Anaerolineae bacterium]
MGTYIVLLGLPGAGKGTQAALLKERLGLPHVTSGGLFREIAEQQSELADKVRAIMAAGDLVPDTITIEIVKERISRDDAQHGVILDGFPRTVPQAEALDALLGETFDASVTLAPFIKLSEAEALERLGGRWVCTQNPNHMYHMKFNPPKADHICDIDGAPLYQREDDTPEAHKHRLDVYMEKTAPLIDYYRDKGLLVEIDGEQSIEAVQETVIAAIESAAQS